MTTTHLAVGENYTLCGKLNWMVRYMSPVDVKDNYTICPVCREAWMRLDALKERVAECRDAVIDALEAESESTQTVFDTKEEAPLVHASNVALKALSAAERDLVLTKAGLGYFPRAQASSRPVRRGKVGDSK